MNGDSTSLNLEENSGGPGNQGMKLPLDGRIGFFSLPPRVQLTKQMATEWAKSSRDKIRPWSVFCSTGRFKPPPNPQTVPRRVVKNIEYFQSNYLFIFIGLFIYCLVTSPILLLVFGIYFGLCYYISITGVSPRVTNLLGRELSLTQLYSIVGLCSLPVFYIVGAGAVLFWVLGASCFFILLHAVMYDIHAILEPEEESFDLTMEEVV